MATLRTIATSVWLDSRRRILTNAMVSEEVKSRASEVHLSATGTRALPQTSAIQKDEAAIGAHRVLEAGIR
jgi:hypothetical protein